ncbi:MAG: PEGA domain-containing protein [Bacteroidales bacterium]|nr:PEGA domain-containing protein [Bacteroidales bacterium]
MRTGRGVLVAGLVLTLGLATGCVDRRFVVESNVPGAQIYVDGKPIGPAPADAWYTYPGVYEFKAVAPNYQPLKQQVRLKAKWYDYPPLDFIADVLWPGRIEDVRRVQLTLEPTRPVRTDQLIQDADMLRARGQSLPPSTVPEEDDPRLAKPALPKPAILPPGPPVPPSRRIYPPQVQNPNGMTHDGVAGSPEPTTPVGTPFRP